MIRQLRASSVIGLTLFMSLAAGLPVAVADVPAALDRLPANAGVVIAIPNMQKLQDAMKVIQDTFQMGDEEADMGVPMEVMNAAGLNKGGSMAVGFVFPEGKDDADEPGDVDNGDDQAGEDQDGEDQEGEDQDGDDQNGDDAAGEDMDDEFEMEDEQQPTTYIIVPVSDFKAFAAALGGDAATGIAVLQAGDEDMFGKDIGGGFAALSPDRATLESFEGKGGSLGAYKALFGKSGARLSESSDFLVVANLSVMTSQIKQGLSGARDNIGMFGGAEMAAAVGVIQAFGDAITTDGQAAMFGLDVEADGLRIETAATFKEGSKSAALLTAPGKAAGLIGSLPAAAQGFLFAGAMDMTAPGLKKLLNNYADEETKAALAASEQNSWLSWLNKSEGAAGVIGTSPALMGGTGLFVNTLLYARTPDPAGLVGQFRKATTDLNGTTQNNVTMTTTYKAGASTVAGASVDEWQMVMKMGADGPQQAQMAMGMLFGPKGGPGGLVAPAKSGVVMTLSKNSALMEAGLKAASGEGANFAADPGVASVASKLPEGRAFEVYIGVRDIMNMVLPMAAMFGAGPINVDVPADLAPIGMGGTLSDGAVRISTYVPTGVLKTFAALGQEMNQMGGGEDLGEEGGDEEGQDGGGRPRF